jgi:AcrR family transcriptional regulator
METATVHRPYHHGNLRAALLDTAARMVDENGVQDLSLRELAREVGVSHGAPRRHFPDKQALLEALAEEGFNRLEAEMRTSIADDSKPFADRLAALGTAYLKFATQHPALLELMFAIKHREGSENVLEAGERAFSAPIALFEEGQRNGEIVAGDIHSIASVAFATLHGLAALANGGMVESELLEHVVPYANKLMMDGLRPRG